MYKLLTLSLFILCSFSVKAQTGSVRGEIQNAAHSPLENCSVVVVGAGVNVNTNSEGAFNISNLKAGTYTLKISRLGYASKEITAKVSAGKTTDLQVVELKESNSNLDEVTVTGSKPNRFAREKSTTVSKMPLKDIENPQVYNSISSVLLKDQVINNFDDALKNSPGIDRLWESTGRGGDGAGYFSLRGFATQPTMINGLPGLTNGSPDIANVESIEVIKGPSGTLYGSSLISYGGLININTKRPFFGFGGNVSYTAASYGLHRVTADINTRLSATEKIALRLNTAYHTQDSYQDQGFKKSLFIAPSLAYEVNDKLSFLVNTEFYQGKSTNQPMLFVDRAHELRVHNLDELNYDHKRSYTDNDLYIETPSFNMQSQMNYKFSDKWSSQTVFSSTRAKSEGYYSYLYEVTTDAEELNETQLTDGIILSRYTSNQDSKTNGIDIQQNFLGDFNIGNVRNRLLVGVDYFKRTVTGNSTGYGNQGFIYLGRNTAQFQGMLPALHAFYQTSPTDNVTDDSGILSRAGADAGIAALGDPLRTYSKSKEEVYSAYISDVVNVTPQLSAQASLRIDRFKNNEFSQTALSPKFGLVYQPVLDKVAVFANYLNGFSNVAPITTPSNVVFTFDPEHANQFEFGTKLNVLNDRLSATVSYYNVTVSDIVLNVSQDVYTQGGEQNSQGFEASVIASPLKGLNLIAGYSYNDSKLENGDADFEGRRPESAGPANLANLWATYKFSQGFLNHAGVGFGGNYGSENRIFNRNLGGTFTLPSYTILNASAFYDVKAFRVTLKLDNIANKEYYKGWSTISPQALRTFSANFIYNF